MAKFTWNEENVSVLTNTIGPVGREQVSQAELDSAAEALGTTKRSVGSKLRKMGYDVQKASEVVVPSVWTEELTASLVNVIESNPGVYTYGEVAAQLGLEARQVQGKVLSLELTGKIRKTPVVEQARSYSEAEEAKIIEMVASKVSIEDLASAMSREESSVRGKCLSLFKEGKIAEIPLKSQATAKKVAADPFEGIDVANSTVAELAAKIEKTERSIKTMLTRRSLTASDYDGAAKAEKNAAKRAAQ